MPTTSDDGGIPATVLARYRKLKAMADATSASETERKVSRRLMRKLKSEHPGIAQVVARDETYQRIYQDVRHNQYGGIPKPEQVQAPTTESWSDMLRRASMRLVGVDPVRWSLEKLEEAVQAQVRYIAEHDDEIDWSTFMETYLTLYEELEKVVDVEVEDAEDDDGREYVIIELTFPVSLVDRMGRTPKSAAQLGAFVLREIMAED